MRTPVAITAPGKYRTRSGLLVEIFEIKDSAKAWANCHGYLVKPWGTYFRRYWNTWHASGRFCFVGDSDLDIVERIAG